jgi:PAS domain S-box-containing protein
LTAILILGSVSMIAVIWWYYARQREAIETTTMQDLAAISQVKVNEIADWRRERIGDGRVQSSPGTLRIARRLLTGRDVRPSDRADLLDVMRRLEEEFGYTGTALVDSEGNILIQTAPNHPVPSRIREFARAAAQADDVRLEDLYLDRVLGRPLMAVTIPVHDLGAIVLEIDPSRFLYPLLSIWPTPSTTAESLLVRREGANEALYLNELRHRRGTALVFRRPISPSVPADRHLEKGWSVKGFLDYRGTPIIGTVRRVPDSPWYLITKIDVVEVEAPVRRLAWEMALITALIGVANIAGVGFIWRGQRQRNLREREAWYWAMANDTPAYLWTASSDGEISFINAPLMKFLGTDQQRLSKNWTAFLHPDDADRARATFHEAVGSRCGYLAEFRVLRYDGEYRRLLSEGVPRFSSEGELFGYAGSMLDITDRRLAEEQAQAANVALAAELEERTRNEQEIRSLSARLINAQEEERARLARDLHDDLSQQIAVLSIAVGNLKRQIPGQESDARSQSDRIQQKLVQLADGVRRLSHELHPAVLQHSGLASALQSYCDEFVVLTGIRLSFRSEGSFDHIPAPVALGLYRIAQEALKNVTKHSNATDAEVTLQYSEGLLCLTVADRGVGMDVNSKHSPGGLGLISIKERTRLLSGTIQIRSQANQGTTITVRVDIGSLHQSARA